MAQGTDCLLSQEALIRFKELLKEARVSQGASFESLAQQTKIPRSHLIALEDGRFEDLPPRVFVRGFLKNLSKELKIDEPTLLKSFELANPEVGKNLLFDARKAITPPKKTQFAVNATAISNVFDRLLLGVRIAQTRLIKSLMLLVNGISQQKIRVVLLVLVVVVVSVPLTRYLSSKWTSYSSDKISNAVQISTDSNVNSSSKIPLAAGTIPEDLSITNTDLAEVTTDLEPISNDFLRENISSSKVLSTQLAASPVVRDDQNPLNDIPKTVAPEIQSLKVKVISPVDLHVSVDGKREISGLQKVGDFEFIFKSTSDLLVSDGAKIEVMFNGRSLGALGDGRRRKLRFQANPSPQDFPY